MKKRSSEGERRAEDGRRVGERVTFSDSKDGDGSKTKAVVIRIYGGCVWLNRRRGVVLVGFMCLKTSNQHPWIGPAIVVMNFTPLGTKVNRSAVFRSSKRSNEPKAQSPMIILVVYLTSWVLTSHP